MTVRGDDTAVAPDRSAARCRPRDVEPGRAPRPEPSGPRVAAHRGCQLQRVRTESAARAAAPAVEVRSTSGPSRTGRAPAAASATTSPSLSPPSGPTTTAIEPDRGRSTRAIGWRACSCSTSARSTSASAPHTWRVVSTSVTSGTRGRRDCLLAARAAARHLATPLAARSSRQRVTQREAAHGTIRSTPSSVASSTARGPRSPFGSACTSTSSRAGGGTSWRAATRTCSPCGPAATTSPSATVPRPSPTRTRSPGVSRSTSTACRPSAPSTSRSAVSGSSSSRNRGAPSSSGSRSSVGTLLTASLEQPGEEPAVALGTGGGRTVLAAQRGQLAQQLLLLGVQAGRRLDIHVHHQVASAGGAQPRSALGAQGEHAARLGARPDVDLLLAVEGVQGEGGAQRGGGHRQGDPAVQVLAVPGEDVVRPLGDLHVQVAGRTAAGTDLAVAGEPDPHAVLDAGRDLDRDGPPGPHAPVATALETGLRDDLPGAGAGRAGAGGDDLAQEGALHALHLPAARAGGAGGRVGAGRGAGAGARVAEDGGVDGDVLGGAEHRPVEVEVEPDERVTAGADPAARTPRAGPAAEEGVHDVAEPAEAGPAEPTGPGAGAVVERVAAEVDDAALLRVGQGLVGAADLLEALLGRRVGVDVGVQVPGQPPIGLLDVGVGGSAGQAQHAVVVGCHREVSYLSSRPGSGRRSGPRLAPRPCWSGSPCGWGRRCPARRGRGHRSRTPRRRPMHRRAPRGRSPRRSARAQRLRCPPR